MTDSYRIALVRAESGPLVALPGGGGAVPSPALVRVHRPYAALAFELTIERVGERWPVVTAVKVISADEPAEAITATQLRDMRFGQVRQACVSFLQRGSRDEEWADELAPATIAGVLGGGAEADLRAPEWMRDLPPHTVRKRPSGESYLGPDPEWLTSLKLAGPGDEATMRAVAALYRYALSMGQPPNLTIEQQLELSNSTASRWIARARSEGLLDQSPRRPRADRKSDA